MPSVIQAFSKGGYGFQPAGGCRAAPVENEFFVSAVVRVSAVMDAFPHGSRNGLRYIWQVVVRRRAGRDGLANGGAGRVQGRVRHMAPHYIQAHRRAVLLNRFRIGEGEERIGRSKQQGGLFVQLRESRRYGRSVRYVFFRVSGNEILRLFGPP